MSKSFIFSFLPCSHRVIFRVFCFLLAKDNSNVRNNLQFKDQVLAGTELLQLL